jgi:hypothetical protein
MSVRFRTAAVIISLGLFVRALHAGPTGACCNADTCACTTAESSEACAAPHSFFAGAACSPSPCVGACCDALSCACTAATASTCTLPNVFMCGAACASNPCIGWCYNESTGECTRTLPGDCEGIFRGCLGCITCNTACCDLSSGACYVTTACSCPQGTFRPTGAPCFSQPSPCGACCDPSNGSCQPTHPTQGCPYGTVYIPSTSSSYTACTCPYVYDPAAPCSTPCEQLGACCNNTACSITVAAGCAGEFQGPGTACGPAGNPTTCCPANVDGADGVAMKDIFDFLNLWLAGGPGSDFNRDGIISVQDIVDMITAWFAGC